MTLTFRILLLMLSGLAMAACSSTEMTNSWSNSNFKGPIKKVYIVGIAKSESVNKEIISKNMVERGCDSVLLTRLVGQRKETVTTPAHVSGYSSGPYYGGPGVYARPVHYSRWGHYYGHAHDIVYEPTTSTEIVILTVESVMYDLKTEQLIWSAQFETEVEGSIDEMMQDYVKEVTKDLKKKGLI